MNSKISNLFKLKSEPILKKVEEDLPQQSTEEVLENEETRKRTYHEAGFRDSSRNSGSSRALKVCLDAIYAKFQNEEKEMNDKQLKIKEPYFNEQKNKETELKGLQVSLENKEEQISRISSFISTIKEKIEKIKFEINDLARNPEAYHINAKKGASTKFWIGLLLLVPISLYLFTFYISTSYSAFFKNFDPNSNIIQNVLDPNAFTNAWKDGSLEGAFVTLIPFVFLGLGYLIHMFGENKGWQSYFKITILFITTFIFDAILAYQIEEKLYNLNKTFDSPEFDLAIAFTKVQFWGIIFAGFVVYVIWGLVFDFVMKEHREKDKIKNEQSRRLKDIAVHKENISEQEKQNEKLIAEAGEIKQNIAKTKGRIEELQRIIDAVIIPTREYKLYASEYLQGWITYINEKMTVSNSEKKSYENECYECYTNNLNEVGANADSQNSVYLSVL